jgi:hypothetical protein
VGEKTQEVKQAGLKAASSKDQNLERKTRQRTDLKKGQILEKESRPEAWEP